MRLRLLAAFLLLIAPGAAISGGKVEPRLRPSCGGEFQLCRYLDADSGVERIPRRFEVANPFSEGLAAVRIDGRYGFIDTAGRFAIAPRFQAAGDFSHGYAEVRLDNASGIVDRTGRLVVPAQFARIVPFANHVFIALPLPRVASTRRSLDDRLEGLSDIRFITSGGTGGLYDSRRGWLTGQDLEFARFDTAARGLIWAGKDNADHEHVWGLLRSDGTWLVTPRYNHVQGLVEGRAIVTSMPDHALPYDQRDAVRWGAVDSNGTLVVPLRYAYLSYSQGGYLRATERPPYNAFGPQPSRVGLVRADGTLLANRYFDAIDGGSKDRLPRGRLGKIWYSIRPDGRLMGDELEGSRVFGCAGGLSGFLHRDMVEFHRPDGSPIGRFDKGYLSDSSCPGPFTVTRGGKWFIVRQDGVILGDKDGFDDIYDPNPQGHTAVQIGHAWGIIDRSGKFTVGPQFAKLSPSSNDTFAVESGDKTYWIDATGKRVAKPAEKPSPPPTLGCGNGLHYIESAGLWGLQRDNGVTVIEPRYRALSCFFEGVSWAAIPGGYGWCPIGPDGRRRHAIECRETFYPTALTEHYPQRFSSDPYESSVLWNRAWLDYKAGRRKPPRWISVYDKLGAYSVMAGPSLGQPITNFMVMRENLVPLLALLLAVGAAGMLGWRKIRAGASPWNWWSRRDSNPRRPL